jgi:dCTP deaminase
MSRLSFQSIKKRCSGDRPMISPYSEEKLIISGKSCGASAASYDCRIAHDLVIGVNPAYIIVDHIMDYGFNRNAEKKLKERLRANPPYKALANTIENFIMPNDLSADVADKSTYARLFLSAFNTFTDPGFDGNLTLELVSHEDRVLHIKAGDPICQLIFTALDEPTERPYKGKYQGQKAEPTAAILEESVAAHLFETNKSCTEDDKRKMQELLAPIAEAGLIPIAGLAQSEPF